MGSNGYNLHTWYWNTLFYYLNPLVSGQQEKRIINILFSF